MFDNIRNLLRSSGVVHVAVDGNDKITKIEFGGKLEKTPNTIHNLFDLQGYELRSDSIEIFDGKKCLGRGYVGDVSGVTVNIQRAVAPLPTDEVIELPPVPQGLAIVAKGIAARIKPDLKGQEEEDVPCVLVEGEPVVTVLRFKRLRKIPGAIIDDEDQKRYIIKDNTRTEIIPPSGKGGMGYVCDPTGQTIIISRSVHVMKLDKNGREVECGINFSGRIGRHATSQKLTTLFAMASGRENLVTLILIALIANIIGVVFHI